MSEDRRFQVAFTPTVTRRFNALTRQEQDEIHQICHFLALDPSPDGVRKIVILEDNRGQRIYRTDNWHIRYDVVIDGIVDDGVTRINAVESDPLVRIVGIKKLPPGLNLRM